MRELIKKILRESVEDGFDWVGDILDSVPDDTELYVLHEVYGINLNGIEEIGYSHYGINHGYRTEDGEEYFVGTKEEFDEALEEYFKNLVDELEYEGFGNMDDYLDIPDWWKNDFCREEGEYSVDGLDDDDIIDRCNDIDGETQDEYDALINKKDELETEISELEEEQLGLDDESERYIEINDLLVDRELYLKSIEKEIEKLVEYAKEKVSEDYESECLSGMDDPVNYLIRERGLFSNTKEMLDNLSGITIDTDELVKDLVRDGSYADISTYDGNYDYLDVEGVRYYTIRTN